MGVFHPKSVLPKISDFNEEGATSHFLALSRSVLYRTYVRQTEMGKVGMETVRTPWNWGKLGKSLVSFGISTI